MPFEGGREVEDVSPAWRDGFLFVGNHPSLDFVNTRPVMNGQPVELLSGWNDLLRWFRAAQLLFEPELEGLWPQWENRPEAEALVDRLRAFRESVRAAVLRREAGQGPGSKIVAELNLLLRAHPMFLELRRTGGGLERRRLFELRRPDDLLAPIADAAAGMLADLDPARLRQCQGCVLHFYDTSKNGTRRWCSMQLCGNRSKVAAYAERTRRAKRP
jgi:predicted RNA-binding Zn ribbon-like protein